MSADIDYRDVVQGLSEGVAIVGADGVVLDLNPSAERILGVRAEDIVGYRLLDLPWQTWDREGRERPREQHPSLVATQTNSVQLEQVLCMVNPSVADPRWVACTSHPLYRDGESAPYASATSFRDVTMQVHAEEGRATALARFDTLVSTLEAGVLVEDEARRMVIFNPSFIDMFAVPEYAAQLMGRDGREGARLAMHLFRDPDRFLSSTEQLSERRERVAGDRLHLIDGRVLERDYLPITLDNAQKGNLWLFRDVTDRHRAEILKDEMIGLVSHELRNPLSSIFGSLRLLAGTALQMTTQQAKLLDVAVRNTDLLMRLVNDLLEIDRIESGAIPMKLTSVPASSLLADAQMATSGAAAAAAVDLIFESSSETVVADHDRVLQVLINLISNATKFSEPGTSIRVTAVPRFGAMLFSVRDTGRGIPAHKRESVFNRFEQVDRADSRRGSGLGLYICRMIVSQHGGDIWVESEEGSGSTFHFTVPMAMAATV